MHWLIWVFIAVSFSTAYRLGYKLLSGEFTALFNVAVITLVASIVCFILYFIREHNMAAFGTLSLKSIVPLAVVGVILAGLEVSIMMIYRAGGPLSISQTLASSMTGIIVFGIGVLWFKDHLNAGQIAGFFLGLTGISLLTYYSYAKP
jgi:drug/metabolite transporter (DMT)-like permease